MALTTRVRLFPEARLAAVAVHGPHRPLPAAVRVVDHDVGVGVARLIRARPCLSTVGRRENVHRHLEDLIAGAAREATHEHDLP